MQRAPLILIVIVFAAFFMSGFGEKHNAGNVLTAKISTDKNIYKSGEPVKMTVTLINSSSEAISAYFSSGQKYDFKVLCVKRLERWKWSNGKMFTMAIQSTILHPGKSMSYSYTWDQKDNYKRQVSQGKYYVIGEVSVSPRVRSAEKEITIR